MAEEKDLGKIISHALLFFKQQFWNYLNCLFITTAPFFILFLFSFFELGHSDYAYFFTHHWMSAGSLSAVLGILTVFNVSTIYMVIYNEGTLKIKVGDIVKKVSECWGALLSYHFSLFVFLTFCSLLVWFIHASIQGSAQYYLYLSIGIILTFMILPILYFTIHSALLKAIRDNHGFSKSSILTFLYLKQNWVFVWSVTVVGFIIALLLRYLPLSLPLLLFYIGNFTARFDFNTLLLEHRTIIMVITVAIHIFGIYLATFMLITHQILFFSLEEKYKGLNIIKKIKNIGE